MVVDHASRVIRCGINTISAIVYLKERFSNIHFLLHTITRTPLFLIIALCIQSCYCGCWLLCLFYSERLKVLLVGLVCLGCMVNIWGLYWGDAVLEKW
jgi:hypothetical protein